MLLGSLGVKAAHKILIKSTPDERVLTFVMEGSKFPKNLRNGTVQVSISSTFYTQLLHVQIPKVQKKAGSLTVFLFLLGSAFIKAAHKTLVKSTPEV